MTPEELTAFRRAHAINQRAHATNYVNTASQLPEVAARVEDHSIVFRNRLVAVDRSVRTTAAAAAARDPGTVQTLGEVTWKYRGGGGGVSLKLVRNGLVVRTKNPVPEMMAYQRAGAGGGNGGRPSDDFVGRDGGERREGSSEFPRPREGGRQAGRHHSA